MKTSEILPGDVLFVGGKGLLKSLIEWITHLFKVENLILPFFCILGGDL